jgi:hypothetical protein
MRATFKPTFTTPATGSGSTAVRRWRKTGLTAMKYRPDQEAMATSGATTAATEASVPTCGRTATTSGAGTATNAVTMPSAPTDSVAISRSSSGSRMFAPGVEERHPGHVQRDGHDGDDLPSW